MYSIKLTHVLFNAFHTMNSITYMYFTARNTDNIQPHNVQIHTTQHRCRWHDFTAEVSISHVFVIYIKHDKQLTGKTMHMNNSSFIVTMLYKGYYGLQSICFTCCNVVMLSADFYTNIWQQRYLWLKGWICLPAVRSNSC